MAKEIERKFLVKSDEYKQMATARCPICQCYISTVPEATVRLRLNGDTAFITVKGLTRGAERSEWEYPVPVADAIEMAHELCSGWAVEKTRYLVPFNGFVWEVDEFSGRLSGLVVAEVELPDAATPVQLPPFIGLEVTGDPRYYNSTLSACPAPPSPF